MLFLFVLSGECSLGAHGLLRFRTNDVLLGTSGVGVWVSVVRNSEYFREEPCPPSRRLTKIQIGFAYFSVGAALGPENVRFWTLVCGLLLFGQALSLGGPRREQLEIGLVSCAVLCAP